MDDLYSVSPRQRGMLPYMYLPSLVFSQRSVPRVSEDILSHTWRTYMLVDQDYCDILPLLCEIGKRLLNRRVLGFGIDNEEVLLSVWGLRDMLRTEMSAFASCYKVEI